MHNDHHSTSMHYKLVHVCEQRLGRADVNASVLVDAHGSAKAQDVSC